MGERLIGTYMHGPVLPRNLALADHILSWVVGDLSPLDSTTEEQLRATQLDAGSARRRAQVVAGARAGAASRRSVRDLADLLDLLVRLVGVGSLDLEQLVAGALGFGLGAFVGGGQPGLDAFGHDPLAFVDQRVDHFGFGHGAHDLALHEQVALAPTGGDAEVRFTRLPVRRPRSP